MLIDLHGLRDALRIGSNSRAAVVEAIGGGEMLVLRSAAIKLEKTYEKQSADLKGLKPQNKYIKADLQCIAIAASTQQSFGSSLFGGIPHPDHFEALAVAQKNGLTLVSSSKGLADLKKIVSKCDLPKEMVVDITDVAG